MAEDISNLADKEEDIVWEDVNVEPAQNDNAPALPDKEEDIVWEDVNIPNYTTLDADTGEVYSVPATMDETDTRFAIDTQQKNMSPAAFIGKMAIPFIADAIKQKAEDRIGYKLDNIKKTPGAAAAGVYDISTSSWQGQIDRSIDYYAISEFAEKGRLEKSLPPLKGVLSKALPDEVSAAVDEAGEAIRKVVDMENSTKGAPWVQKLEARLTGRAVYTPEEIKEARDNAQELAGKAVKLVDDWRKMNKERWEKKSYELYPKEARGKKDLPDLFYGVANGATSIGGTMAATLITKNPAVAAVWMGKTFYDTTKSEAFQEAKAMGEDFDAADWHSTMLGVFEGGLEGIGDWLTMGLGKFGQYSGLSKVMKQSFTNAFLRAAGKKGVKPAVTNAIKVVARKSPSWSAAFKGFLAEGPFEETIQNLSSDYYKNAIGWQDKANGDIWGDALWAGFVGGITGFAAAGGGSVLYNRKMQHWNNELKEVIKHENPGISEDDAQQAADLLQESYLQEGMPIINELNNVLAKEKDVDALPEGGLDIKSIGEVTRNLMKEKFGVTDEEIDNWVNIMLPMIDARNQYNEAYTTFYDKFVEGGLEEAYADGSARMLAARATTAAIVSKRPVADIIDRFKLKIVDGRAQVEMPGEDKATLDAENIAVEPATQEELDLLQQDINRLKRGVTARKKAKGIRLAQFIVQNGGIADDRGDIKAMGSMPGLLNKNGISLDEAARMAWDAGYITGTERPDVNRLLDLLSDDLGNRPVYTENDQLKGDNNDYYRSIEQAFDEAGVDIEKDSVEEVDRKLKVYKKRLAAWEQKMRGPEEDILPEDDLPFWQSARKENAIDGFDKNAPDNAFVKSRDGNIAHGIISEEIAKEAGIHPGEIRVYNQLYKHLSKIKPGSKISRLEQIRKLGYENLIDFIDDVMENLAKIQEGTDGSLLLTSNIGRNNTVAVRLEEENGYYKVTTVMPRRKIDNKNTIWEAAIPLRNESGQPAIIGPNGNISIAPNNTSVNTLYDPKMYMPAVRGGWTKNKILDYMKKGSLRGVGTATRMIAEFDNVQEFKDHMFYHGARYGTSERMRPSITMSSDEVGRIGGGGYGEKYWAISLSKSKKIAGNFATAMGNGNIYPVLLVKNANVIEMPELEDSADLEDHIEQLYNDGVDAVWVGDKNSGEQELAVINPRAIVNIGTPQFYKAYKLGQPENPINIRSDEEIQKMFDYAKDFVAKYPKTAPDEMIADAKRNVFWQMPGPKAKTAALDRLDKAKQLDASGTDSDQIWKQTGWYKGADNKWRFEIPDGEIREDFNIDQHREWIDDGDGGQTAIVIAPLEDIYDNEKLYEAYPEMRKMPVQFSSALRAGVQGISFGGTISLSSGFLSKENPEFIKEKEKLEATPEYQKYNAAYETEPVNEDYEGWHKMVDAATDEFFKTDVGKEYHKLMWEYDYPIERTVAGLSKSVKETLVHEIQHEIQKIEGFAKGGSNTEYGRKSVLNALKAMADANKEKERIAFLEERIGKDKAKKLLQQEKIAGDLMRESMEKTGNFSDEAMVESDKYVNLMAEYGISKDEMWDAMTNTPSQKKLDYAAQLGADNIYELLFGEVEARNASKRMDMSEEERRVTAPDQTQDVKNADAIVVFEDGAAAAYKAKESAPVAPQDDKNLVMTHSAKIERINDIIDTGSLIAPSMAITNKNQNILDGFGFGEVIFIRNPNSIDFRRDNIYDRDIYSPRMPAATYKTKEDGYIDPYEYTSLENEWKYNPEKFKESHGGKTFDEYFKGAEKVLYKGFTPAGYRRYVPYTASNILAEMKQQGLQNGEHWGYGLSSFLATLGKKQTSMKRLKAVAGDLGKVEIEAYDKLREQYDSFESKLRKYAQKDYNGSEYFMDIYSDVMRGIATNNMRILNEFLDMEKLQAENPKLLQEARDFVATAVAMKRSYFEAKPMREVPISEFSAVMVPKEVTEEQRQGLRNLGLNVVEYERGHAGEALKGLQNEVFFQAAGVNAKTAALDQLDKAKQLEAQGTDMEEIRQQTGWHKWVDGKWRFEISDKDAKVDVAGDFKAKKQAEIERWRKLEKEHPETAADVIAGIKGELHRLEYDDVYDFIADRGGYDTKLGDILQHDKLYAAYPDLRDVGIYFYVDNNTATGGYVDVHRPNRIYINVKSKDFGYDKLKTVLLHEVQHYIQIKEGFARGGSENDFADAVFENNSKIRKYHASLVNEVVEKKFGKKFDTNDGNIVYSDAFLGKYGGDWRYEELGLKPQEVIAELRKHEDEIVAKEEAYYKKNRDANIDLGSYEYYKRIAGEVEARNTEARADMSEEELRATPPEQTQDVENADAIVVFGDGTSMAYAPAQQQNTMRPQGARGSFTRRADTGEAIIELFKTADASTIIHELGHFFLDDMKRFADDPTTAEQLQAIYRYVGSMDGNLSTEQHEYFARSFEAYIWEGRSPNSLLKKVFDNFRKWLRSVYSAVTDLDVDLDDNIRKVFDEMLGGRRLDFAMQQGTQNLQTKLERGFISAWNINKAMQLLHDGKMSKADMQELINELKAGKMEGKDFGNALKKFEQSNNNHRERLTEWDYNYFRTQLDNLNFKRDKVKERIMKLLDWTKPRSRGGKLVGRFPDKRLNDAFDHFRELANMPKDEAMAKQQENLKLLEQYNREGGDIDAEQLIFENKLLSLATGRISNDTLLELYEALSDSYNEGRLTDKVTGEIKKARKERMIAEAKEVLTDGGRINWHIENRGLKAWIQKQFRNLGRSQMSWSGLLDVLSINDSSSKTGQSLLSKNLDMFEAEQVMYAGVAQDGENISTRLEKALSGSSNKAISVNRYINKELDKEVTIEWTGDENLGKRGMKAKPFMIRKTFTKDKLIDIYMKAKDKDTLDIMKQDKIHQYNDEFLAKVEAELTEDDIAVADALFAFYNDNYDRFNKFYEDHFGISLTHNKYYSPRSMTRNGINVDDGSPRAYASFSGAKQRIAMAGSATINIKGAFAALNKYVQDLNHYMGYADKLQDINAVMGNKDIKEIIANVFGGGMNARIQYEIENMANSGTRAKGSSRFWNKVRSNYARSVLSVKPSLAIKQLTSFPAYWENMSTVDFIGGVADFFKHPKEAMKILGNTTLMKTRGTNIIRDFEVMSKTDTFKNMKKSAGKIKWSDLLMANIKFGDRGAIYIGGWALYKAELKKNLAAGMSEADAKAAALNRFERVTDETQQSGRLSQQSYMQSNSMLRAFTMFTSSQNQYLRKEINAIRGLVSGRMDKKQVAKTIFIYHFLLPMFFQAVSDGFRWDKDAQLRTAALGSLNGWFILNKVLENIYNKITGQASMFKANMTVRELVPFFGSMEDIYKDIEKLLDGDIEAEDVIKSVKTIGELTGLPLKYATDVALRAGDYAEEGEYGKEGLLWLGWSPYSLRDFAE